MSKKVVIVTEEWAGSGHRMAAIALKQALQDQAEDVHVQIVGGLANSSPLLREVSRLFYMNSLRHYPILWQRLYNGERRWSRLLQSPLGNILAKKLLETLLERESPDVVVATHAYCLTGLATAKKAAKKKYQLVSVPTDFHLNHFWIHPEIDHYVVAHERIADEVTRKYGIDRNQIAVHGIPVRTMFAKGANKQKEMWKAGLGLQPNLFTVLLSGGEGGYGDMSETISHLMKLFPSLQLVVVTGKNEQLRQHLISRFAEAKTHRLHIRGYEPAMWEWIGAADVYLTKPGGISCSEALAMKTPLLLYQPLPGPEMINLRFLQEQQVAEYADSLEQVVAILSRWQEQPQAWLEVVSCMEKISRPDAAYLTAKLLLRL